MYLGAGCIDRARRGAIDHASADTNRIVAIFIRRHHIALYLTPLVALLLLLQTLVAPGAAGACRAESCRHTSAVAQSADSCADECESTGSDCESESDDTMMASGDVACIDGRAPHEDERLVDVPDTGCEPSGECAGDCFCCVTLAPVMTRPASVAADFPASTVFPPARVAALLMLPRSVDHPPCRTI